MRKKPLERCRSDPEIRSGLARSLEKACLEGFREPSLDESGSEDLTNLIRQLVLRASEMPFPESR